MPTPDGPQFIEFSDPDGSQFQNLWDSAMAGAQANLDALSDEELEGGAFLADPGGGGEWIDDPDAGPRISRGGDRIADAIRRGYYTEEHRRSIHGESDPAFPGHDMNLEGPDYSQPDPFDTSDPEQAAQAENIEEAEQLFSRWDEERDRNRRGL